MSSNTVESKPPKTNWASSIVLILFFGGLVLALCGVVQGVTAGERDAATNLDQYASLQSLPWGLWSLQVVGDFVGGLIDSATVFVLDIVMNIFTLLGILAMGGGWFLDRITKPKR